MNPLRKPVRILKAYQRCNEWCVYDPGSMPAVMTPEYVEFHVGDRISGILRGVYETDECLWILIDETDQGT